MQEAAWIAGSTAFGALVAVVATQVIRVMDSRHNHTRQLNQDTQKINDDMFRLLREEIQDQRQRVHDVLNAHASCEYKLQRMSGRVDYLEAWATESEETMRSAGLPYIPFRKWAEHGPEDGDPPEERTWPR